MSILTEVERLLAAKAGLKEAINAKGGSITDETIDAYPEAVSGLPEGMSFYKCTSVDSTTGTWSGIKYTMNDAGCWEAATDPTTGLVYTGFTPEVDSIYSEDTTVQVQQLILASDRLMVCLVHFGENSSKDVTETCVVTAMPQTTIGTSYAKFGPYGIHLNYFQPDYPNGGIIVKKLPPLDAFTLEWWQYNYTSMPMSGLIIKMPAEGTLSEVTMESVNIPYGDSKYIASQWFHHAWVRKAGSSTVTEYVNGQPVGTTTLEGTFGGRTVHLYSGGTVGSNARRWLDEITIFNYAKYSGAYTPPTAEYPDIISNYWPPNPTREVTVSGCVSNPAVNDPSYALVDPAATGTSRVWVTADGLWYIRFNAMQFMWVITDSTQDYGTAYARATTMGMDVDPLNTTWADYNNSSVVVTVQSNVASVVTITGTTSYTISGETGSAIIPIVFDAVASDGSTVTYSLSSGSLPDGVVFDGSGLSGTPTSALSGDVTYVASSPTATNTVTITVTFAITAAATPDEPDGSVLYVSGAGQDECNGTYTMVSGEGNSRVWSNGAHLLKWSDEWTCWVIFGTTDTAYASEVWYVQQTSSTNPWDGTWMVNMAIGPAPTVTEGGSSGGTVYTTLTVTNSMISDFNQTYTMSLGSEGVYPTGTDRVWVSADQFVRIYYNSTESCWMMLHEMTAMTSSGAGDANSNPWDVTWSCGATVTPSA